MTTVRSPVASPDLSLDDIAALKRYASTGDPAAFATLIHRYQNMVLATARRVLRSHADAEDAAQETFLKLARNASLIRGNAAAWLHACAVGSATDLLRRTATRERAERAAPAPTPSNTDDTRTWGELEPLLDRALAELPDEDRNAIIAHYLVGRTNKQLAKEAGVSPGTMSRRIDRALDSLQSKLRAAGLAIAGTAGLAGALAVGAGAATADAALTTSLAKVALAEVVLTGKRAAIPALLTAKSVVALSVVLTGVVGVASVALFGGPFAPTNAPSLAPPTDPQAHTSVPRPKKPSVLLEPIRVTLDGKLEREGQLKFDGDTISFGSIPAPGTPPIRVVMRRDSTSVKDRIYSTRITIQSIENVKNSFLAGSEGKSGVVTAKTAGPILIMDLKLDSAERAVGEIRFLRDPATTPAFPGGTPADPLTGEWVQIPELRLRLEPDAICYITAGGFELQRFRILSWEEAAGQARIETICTDNASDTGAIGKRYKMLLRMNKDEYSIAAHTPFSRHAGAWPTFEPKPGDDVRIGTFLKELP